MCLFGRIPTRYRGKALCLYERESVLWLAAKGEERLNLKFHEVKG